MSPGSSAKPRKSFLLSNSQRPVFLCSVHPCGTRQFGRNGKRSDLHVEGEGITVIIKTTRVNTALGTQFCFAEKGNLLLTIIGRIFRITYPFPILRSCRVLVTSSSYVSKSEPKVFLTLTPTTASSLVPNGSNAFLRGGGTTERETSFSTDFMVSGCALHQASFGL